ncbi:MAG: acetate kinase [Armatimonadetes bacterium]|nr:acetate kinase [Armatimonadota bacterium]
MMKVLVLNCGSSSIKFQLIEATSEEVLARGIVEKIGSTAAILRYTPKDGGQIKITSEIRNHDEALEKTLSALLHPGYGALTGKEELECIGHRVVHGGECFSESVLITREVMEEIEKCTRLAPLHNPHNLKGIEACLQKFPRVPQVAVFDTAFHQTIPKAAFVYAIPYSFYETHGIRRYGFHGTSHHYVSRRAAEILGSSLSDLRIISCHLGNGASMAAIAGGRSVDTTMGFTPLEGLVMGTRSGDLDPAILPFLMDQEKLDPKAITALLNEHSGLKGLSGTSGDMREVDGARSSGNSRAQIAFEVFCHRIKRYIGAFAAVMGGLDALIFTGGIGEHHAATREVSCRGLDFLGISVDPEMNRSDETRIGRGPVAVLVIPTNEELVIARECLKLVGPCDITVPQPALQ